MANIEDVTVSFLLEKMIIFYKKNKVNNKKGGKYQKSENRSKILTCLTVPKFPKQISAEIDINLSTAKSLISPLWTSFSIIVEGVISFNPRLFTS